MSDITTVILAAGNSTRFKASKSKLVYPLCGLPIVSHIFNIAKKISGKNILVVSNEKNKEELKLILNTSKLVVQKKQKGTADAIEQVKKFVKSKNILILFGDTPLVEVKDIRKLVSKFKKSKAKASLIAFNTSEPHGYGRLLLNNNYVEEIIEQINLKPEQKKINLCNSGILIANTKLLFDNLKNIKENKIKKERYLPDICKIFSKKNIPINYIECNKETMLGINTLDDFNVVQNILQKKYVKNFIKNGVNFLNPNTCYLSYDTKIEPTVTIESNVTIKEKTIIKKGSIIKSNSYLEEVTIDENSHIGPSARLRPKTKIGKKSKIGNFVEIKNSKIGNNVSIAHLSYVGDSEIGNNVNIGAGTITCNYDGKKKHKTIIKDNVFIGSNTSLIAPIVIESKSRIGAGSVITKNIPKNSLAIERSALKILRNKRSK